MSFVSMEFVFFLSAAFLVYYFSREKLRTKVLLAACLGFYGLGCGAGALLFLSAYILFIFALGRLLDRQKRGYVLFICILGAMAPLILSRYALKAPLGLSFFSLQAISYLVDIYKQKIESEKNIIDFFLYMSLFVYITSGPIERAGNMLPQFKKGKKPDIQNIKYGLGLFAWGLFQKIVIAERLAIIVDHVYGNYTRYGGIELIIATFAFSFQLFFDFAGYSNMALGLAKLFSLSICQNFEQPYFSASIAEFWRRWHISLSGWLRDYIYIPCGGNRKGKIRKYSNLMITFLISGLWHGAGLNFVIWGALHGAYQILEDVTEKWREKVCLFFKIRRNVFSYRLWRRVQTFVLVSFAWIFFRAPSLRDAAAIIKRMVVGFNPADSFGMSRGPSYGWNISVGLNLSTASNWLPDVYGIDIRNLVVLIFGLLVALGVEIMLYKKKRIFEWFCRQNWLFRCGLCITVVFFLLTFGIYGANYSSSGFIYANF